MRKFLLPMFAVLILIAPSLAQQKPKVRAITAFVRLERATYDAQVRDTLAFLRKAKAEFERRGFEVQTIRITTQPFPDYIRGLSADESLAFFRKYDELAVKEGFDASIGPATVTSRDDREARLLAQVLAQSKVLEGSVTVADENGIRWEAVEAAAWVMKYLEEHTPRSQGNFNFTAAALVPPLTPFYPASWHDGPGHQFAIGLQSASLVARPNFGALRRTGRDGYSEAIGKRLGAVASHVELIAQVLERQTGWVYAGIDLSPAPLKDDSIGAVIEDLLAQPTGGQPEERRPHSRLGASGTLSAAAAITSGVKSVTVKQAGYSGLMLPILEDTVLAQRWSEGAITLDGLLAYSAVCGTGLDTVPLPGDVTLDQLARIITDMATLAVKWNKPLSARLLPVAGKKAGERTEFDDPFLVNTTLQALP